MTNNVRSLRELMAEMLAVARGERKPDHIPKTTYETEEVRDEIRGDKDGK